MYSIGFPDIFNGSTVHLLSDYDAIKSNLVCLLASDKGGLFGDPYYGTKLRTLLWEQTQDPIVLSEIKDDVFDCIYSYMPQITVDRDNITIETVDNVVTASIKVTSNTGTQTDLFNISLLNGLEDN